MKSRCSNPNTNRWHLYGGRGIQVCAQWAASFTQFLADMGECPDGMSLDRIDSNGNYEPGNCRWATMEAQASNTRSNRFVEYGGEKLTYTEWGRRLGSPGIVHRRIQTGWNEIDAITIAPGQWALRSLPEAKRPLAFAPEN